MRQFALFCVSGAIAFVIDAGLTQFWAIVIGLDPWSARGLAFPIAVTSTWLFNRSITFRMESRRGLLAEWLRYCSTQMLGLALNLAVYAVLVGVSDLAARWPALAVAAGSLVGLIANWMGAKYVVFASRP